MTEKSDNKGEKSGDKDKTHWPWWGQFLLAVIALSIACVLLIWLPIEIGSRMASGSNDTGSTEETAFTTFAPMIVVFVGLTTMTISGMFLFMTFRIDRGARLTAREEAGREARKVAKEEAEMTARERTEQIAKEEIGSIREDMVGNLIGETRKLKERAVDYMVSARSEVGKEIDQFGEKLREAKDEFKKGKAQIEDSVEEVKRARGEVVNQMEAATNEAETGVEKVAAEAHGSVRRAGTAAADRMERIETDIADMLKRSVEDVRGRVREAEKEARDRIAEIDAKARAEVKKAGDEAKNDIEDAGKKIEREMKHEMKNIEDEAVNRTTEQVDRLIAEARGKIDAADIGELLNERIEPILARLADRRGGMFSFRGRNPRS